MKQENRERATMTDAELVAACAEWGHTPMRDGASCRCGSPPVPVVGITEQRLAEIEALTNTATEGPWEVELRRGDWEVLGPPFDDGYERGIPTLQDDAEFIAASRTFVSELLVEVRRQRDQIASLKALYELTESRRNFLLNWSARS